MGGVLSESLVSLCDSIHVYLGMYRDSSLQKMQMWWGTGIYRLAFSCTVSVAWVRLLESVPERDVWMYEPLCVIPIGGRDFFLVGVGYEPPHKTLHPIPMKLLWLSKQHGLVGRGELAAVDGCDVCRMEATEGFVDGVLGELGTFSKLGPIRTEWLIWLLF